MNRRSLSGFTLSLRAAATLSLTIHAFRPCAAPRGCIVSEFHHERRLAAQLVTIPELGHAWSGGDPAHPYGDDRFLDATALICDFFAAHAAR